jgi:hypothetical protein
MSLRLSRRTFLRSSGGLVLGLPLLEIMLDNNGTAFAAGGALPKRYVFVFAGQSIGGDGWQKDQQRIAGVSVTDPNNFIAPATTGPGYSLTMPLTPLAALKSRVSVLSNMRIPYSTNSTAVVDVPSGGAYRDFHGGGASPLLSGMRSTESGFRARGKTPDQFIADLNAGLTPIDTLTYRCQPVFYIAGNDFYGRQYISYRGDNQAVPAQPQPSVAFNSMVGAVPSGDPSENAAIDFQNRARKSVLDLVAERRQRLINRVGAADKRRLDAHFEEVVALEKRIADLANAGIDACDPPTTAPTDPAIGGDNAGSGSGDIGVNTGYSGEEERATAFADLIHFAFKCDLTRSATLQLTTFQSHMNVFGITTNMGQPIRADLHEVGHNGDANTRGQFAVSLILKWHIQRYAYLLDKLATTDEGGGKLLDNTVAVFAPEGGHGKQLNDGGASDLSTHSVENMVGIVAGNAGGLMPGKHINTNGAHPAQMFLSAMKAAGYTGNTLGEVSGTIPELFT